MFTGIITDIGRVRSIEPRGDTRLTIATAFAIPTIEIGASIACSGACLTVVDKGIDAGAGGGGSKGWFAVDASAETLSRTTLKHWREGSAVNLERALRVGDELGGHIVAGHVDGLARIERREPEGDSLRFTFRVPEKLARYIAPKGSVALDGVSLTVNEVQGTSFGVNIIPHSQKLTTFGTIEVGAEVNIEIDVLARYVARLKEVEAA